MTLKEVHRKEKGLPIEPPSKLDKLQKNVEVTLALINSLVGENDLYQKLYDLYVVLNTEYTEAVKGTIYPETIRHYFWAIFEEMRDFFNNIMRPQDFAPGNKRLFFPVSTMNVVANRIKYAKEVSRRTYPVEWRMIDKREATQRCNERSGKLIQGQYQGVGGGGLGGAGLGGGGIGGNERRGNFGNQ